MSNSDFFLATTISWFRKRADDVEQQINNQLKYRLEANNIVFWRTEGVQNGLVRWDDRHPDVIFQQGFQPRAIPPESNEIQYGLVDLWRYVLYHDRSVFVSTTRTYRAGTQIMRWQPNDVNDIFEYTIYAYGGIDVNSTLGDHKFSHQNEIAFPGGLRREFILAARQYNAHGQVIRVWVNMQFNLLANEQYQVPYFRLPDVLNWSVGVQVVNWLAPGHYQYYYPLPDDYYYFEQRRNRCTERDDPMWGPGKDTPDPYQSRWPIRACLPVRRPYEAWFFCDDKYVRVKTGPYDQLIAGPSVITDEWQSLKSLGFSTINAFLPTQDGAWVISGSKYGRIAIDSDLHDTRISGPTDIINNWKSLTEAGFRRVDGALPTPVAGEAWVFNKRLYIRIKFDDENDSLVIQPSLIVDNWQSLKQANFDSIDCVLQSEIPNEAWFFQGTRYVRVDVVSDTIKSGPSYVCHDWKSLVKGRFY